MRFLAFVLVLTSCSFAADWPRFRGENGSGVSPERGLPAEIGKDRNLAWTLAAPKGNSSPIVVDGRLWITGFEGDERIVLCYEARTGTLLWRKSVTKGFTELPNPLNGLATPTAASDGKRVVVFFADFGLLAFDRDGKELWRQPLGPFGGVQGMAVSPVLVDDLAVLLIDTPEQAYLAAFDIATGKQAWKVERPIGFLGSYATPSVYKPATGPAQIIVAGAVEFTGYQAKTGERLWWVRGVTYAPATLPLIAGDRAYTMEPMTEAAAAPPFSGMLAQYDKGKTGSIKLSDITGTDVTARIYQRVFGSVDRNSGNNDGIVTEDEWKRAFAPEPQAGGLVQIRLDGKGDVSKTHVGWRHTKGLPYTTSALVYDHLLYSVRSGGILTVFDPETGKVLREERLKDAPGEYYAQPVAADGKIYFASKDGKLTVISAGADWKIVASADFDEQIIATPAIADGRIFLRTAKSLYCFQTKK